MTGYCTISKWFYNCNFSVLNSTFIAFYFFYSILLNSTFSVLNSTGVMCRHQYHKVVIKLFNKRNYNLPNFLCLLSVTVVRTLCFCHLLAVQDWESQFTSLHLSHRRRQWHSTLALLPEKSHGRRSLVGCSPWGHKDWATSLSLFTFMHWRRKWQPTPVFLPGESQG